MIRPFRFWCNKILPVVYDDSLSYYELLAKVVDYLNKVIDQTNANTDYINTLGSMLTDFMKSPEVREIIEAKLDAMAEDGTLDAMINAPKMFVPNEESETEYRSGTLLEIADWLFRAKGSHCVERNPGEPVPEIRFHPQYNTTGKGWQGLIAKDSIYYDDFVYSDVDAGGDQIVYINCTGFCNMLTRGRNYLQSPYYLALGIAADPNKTAEEKYADMRNTCLERGTAMQNTWTFDFLNWIHAFNMFYIMEKSGCTPRAFNANGVWDDKVFDTMETGDILFSARLGNNYYRHIHHCMYYLKSLDDLNTLEGKPNCTFNAFDFSDLDSYPNGGEHGYIVHCTYGVNPVGSANKYSQTADDVIRIESLDHYIVDDMMNPNHVGQNPFVYYVSKPYSNALNSSKARKVVTGTITDGSNVMFGFREAAVFPQYNRFVPSENKWYQGDVAISGKYVTGTTETPVNLNDFVGVISWNTAAIANGKILNVPFNEAGTCISYGVSRIHGAQIAISGADHMAYRKRISGGTWRPWHTVTATVPNEPEEP